MPTYDFQCSAGHTHERALSIKSNPRSRVACREPGCTRMAKRLIGAGGALNTQPVSSSYPYVSDRLPPGLAGCQHVGPMGKPLIESRRHEDRVFKTHGFGRE